MALDTKSKELLWRTLRQLEQDDFTNFQFHMHPGDVDRNANHVDIAEQLEKKHGKNAVEETIKILKTINNYNLAQKLRSDVAQIKVDDLVSEFKMELQDNLRVGYFNAPESNTELSQQKLLEDVYTELYITRGVDGLPNKQHEVLQMEMCDKDKESIEECDIFGSERPIRTMVTVGFAGIGKSFLVRKFVLDWASGRTNRDVHFIFPFTFRKLNLEKEKSFSLAELIHHSIWESKDNKMLDYIFARLQNSGKCHYQCSDIKILFVLDGLDECRLNLDLSDRRKVAVDVTQAYPVEVLLAHLIKRNLLPGARVWITTRPQAASNIPPHLVDSRTEVKGFSDSQRVDYFRKRFPDEQYIIKHIQKSRTIFIMCHMPIFCWLTATVLQDYRDTGKGGGLPKTLTEMYTEFLLYHLDKSKERESQKHIEYVKAMAKLAFQHLIKNQQIFTERELQESGLDYLPAAKYSGVFTKVFKEVPPLKKYQGRTMFQFIHLTIQEYLAALYVMMSLFQDNKNVLGNHWMHFRKTPLTRVHEAAIHKASESDGNLDMFLRFLLGLSLQCNQDLLGELLKAPKNSRHSSAGTVRLIKQQIEQNSPEENINLFYCLSELKDESLLEEIQQYLSSGYLSTEDLSPAMWSALVFVLRASNEAMSCFDLKHYCASERGLLMLLPVVKASQKSVVSGYKLSRKSCLMLASVLSSPCNLRHLDLSNNDLCDDKLEALATGLAKPQCTLQVLGLNNCNLSKKSCEVLASILSSSCSLRDLDLGDNKLYDNGLYELTYGLAKPQCTLQVLRLDGCKLSKKSCEMLASVLGLPRNLRHLDLSYNDLYDDGLKALAAGLAKPQCTLQVLGLSRCNLSKKSCEVLASVLRSPCNLRDLDLSYNLLYNDGLEALAGGLAKPQCTLQVLGLKSCMITTPGCVSLAKALRSNPFHLQELDLNNNNYGKKGKQALVEVQMDPCCSLKTVRFAVTPYVPYARCQPWIIGECSGQREMFCLTMKRYG
ncbi:NACHT, LRR and PYD domains-containing protein 3-like isoform X3 [Syngnathus acus]|uniref:NACHT, LRR and PYD domains-containing protein 3-like isoform X3 n=1 Tax=Syngnathus acus TaxID=161584 RepID=UPI001885CC1E|nr:NACHT, LRR and PYD domains-containing protein 3-like isoform X3 [Syngnathus acus]